MEGAAFWFPEIVPPSLLLPRNPAELLVVDVADCTPGDGACGVPRTGGEPMRARLRTALLAVALLLTACGTAQLPPEGGVDYQLGAAYDADLAIVVRDASAAPLPGAYSLCYVNGFQTQPGILAVFGPVIAGCAEAGFDAVEIDNLDAFTRADGIAREDALALAADYADIAHDHGLEIAQKNAAELSRTLHDELGYDLAVVEECGAYDECAAFTDVYGERVIQVEYPDSLAEAGLTFAEVCAREDRAPHTILRDRELVGPDDPMYVYEAC